MSRRIALAVLWTAGLAGTALLGQAPRATAAAAPGSLLGAKQETLGAVIAGTAVETQRPSLPAGAKALPVLTCSYANGAGASEETHHWLGALPAWHGALPAAHPLRSMVLEPVQACPGRRASVKAPNATAAVVAPPVEVTREAPRSGRAAVPLPSFELTADEFKAKGLEYERVFTSLYLGDFRDVGFNRDSQELLTVLNSYIVTFSEQCRQFLRGDVVEITNWNRQPGLVVRAEADLIEARRQLESASAGRAIGEAFSIIADGGAGALRLVGKLQALKGEVTDVVSRNGCGSRTLRRFRDNLRLYALDERPIVIRREPGETSATPTPPAPRPAVTTKQNWTKLADDLITASSRTWAMNRYTAGSASGGRVVATNEDGTPRRMQASYAFVGFSGRANGTVTVEFSQGRPSCLYFFDLPGVCRAAERSIVESFEQGSYAIRE